MKRLLPIAILLTAFNAVADQQPKYLHYQLNPAVVITISSGACPFPQLKDKYPLAVAAFRVDGHKLPGCYKKYDEDLIEIQWYKGDITVLPANAFLLQPNLTVPVPEATM